MLFFFLALLPVSTAEDMYHQGLLSLIPLTRNGVPHLFGVSQDWLVADDSISYFGYYKTGALALVEAGKYVAIDEHGKLHLDDDPHHGFLLTDKKGTIWMKSVSYKGDAEFQLCADGLIGHKSNCAGAKRILINYERDWPIRD